MARRTGAQPPSMANDAARAETPILQAIAYGIHAPNPEKIQMAVRVGRAERAYVAPRRDPRDFLVSGS